MDNLLLQISVVSQEEAKEIEEATRGQNSSKRWLKERCKRITSSKFGEICKMTERRNIEKKLSTMLSATEIKSASVIHGKKYEKLALEKFQEHEGVLVRECGLFVSTECPMLAASPDGLIGDDTVVEVKCPFTARTKPIDATTIDFLTLDQNGSLTLKTDHNYFYQIQGQLFCTGRQHCRFIVYTFKGIKAIDIVRDEEFIQDMVQNLLEFLFQSF